MDLFNFIVIALAASAIITVWFYGSIFAPPRDYFNKRGGILGELLGCLLCLPYHVAFWTVVLLWLPGEVIKFIPNLDWHTRNLLLTGSRIPLYAFAVTTVIHYVHGILPVGEDADEDDNEDIDESSG